MQVIRWCEMRCAVCTNKVLVTTATLRRVADGETFVTCVSCGDDLVERGLASALALAGSSDAEGTRSDSDERVA